jgi:hypothetical protein
MHTRLTKPLSSSPAAADVALLKQASFTTALLLLYYCFTTRVADRTLAAADRRASQAAKAN